MPSANQLYFTQKSVILKQKAFSARSEQSMQLQISEMGIIKKQVLDIQKDISIIYGYNNSGKTTLLLAIMNTFYSYMMENFISGENTNMLIYIPTNRVVVRETKTERRPLKDIEDFIKYQKDTYQDYSLHLKKLRDELLTNDIIKDFIYKAIKRIFDIDIFETTQKFSDGIENIINIYLCIIWAFIWKDDFSTLTKEGFQKLIQEKRVIILIDEIEMFLHVNIQAELMDSLKQDFSNCNFILTTHSPLFLARCKSCDIYNIENGLLNKIEEDMYYEDLDIIYETLFFVKNLPTDLRTELNYLGEVIMKTKPADCNRIERFTKILSNDYPNLYRRYNKIITKAQMIGV